MCYGCWKEYGSPMIRNEPVMECSRLIAGVYELAAAGGNLHIVIDDWNLEDGSLEFCKEGIDEEAMDDKRQAESKCLKAMKALNFDERASAMAIHDGFDKLKNE